MRQVQVIQRYEIFVAYKTNPKYTDVELSFIDSRFTIPKSEILHQNRPMD